MTEDDVRAAAERLVEFHERFAPLFGKEQAQDHAYTYVKGLMVCPERKSIEPIALNVGDGQVSALQKFLNSTPGTTTTCRPRSNPSSSTTWSPPPPAARSARSGWSTRAASPRRASTAPAWPGSTTAGWARKTTARSGSSSWASHPAARRCWIISFTCPRVRCAAGQAAAERREKVHIPETVTFQTKPQIAAGLIRRTAALGVVSLDWITADEAYGRNGGFLDEVERLELRYVVEVPVTTTVWTEDPASCLPPYGGRGRVPTRPTRAAVAPVAAVASGLGREAWQVLQIRQGAKGPLAFEFTALRVWAERHGVAGPPIWLLVRRSLEPVPEIKYYVSNADASTPLGVLAQVACTRHEVEDYFEDAKSYLGMAQYETRSYVGWHHHMSLVAMAHLFITLTRRVLGKKRRS